MLLVSSHLAMGGYLQHEEGMTYRINMAWRDNIDDIKDDIRSMPGPVFLDNPEGRSKPPNNKYTPSQVVDLYNEFSYLIEYIAVSNVEDIADLAYYREHTTAIIVPKIETIRGVIKVRSMFPDKCDDNYVMLDHDDLLTDIVRNHYDPNELYSTYVNMMTHDCEEDNINILRTAGVVFSDE